MSPKAHTYLAKALDIMEKHALLRDRVDWDRLKDKAFAQARGAQRPEDTYRAIRSALSALGDAHSTFWDPDQAEQGTTGAASSFDGLEARSLKGGIGYVSLPGVNGSQKTYDAYTRRGRDAVEHANTAGTCGWVVDLRQETGGGMWPVLAVAGPILGDGTVGMFVDADGKKIPWTVEKGVPHLAGKPQAGGDAPELGGGRTPVAVLTGRRTASAGEAVAVAFRGRPDTRSFGEMTSGVPTGNNAHRLPDGALLILTEVRDADRAGRTYDEPVEPDEEVVKDPRPTARGEDAVLDAAQRWLRR
ncbi:peptidase S41 [Streptomyces sp. SID5785]|uniref:S41 family peptidase n=1 Tax=Streptomyces sp. SID5785 TaxID=2690309 RepID=UPI001361761A|nr:S41 family peptidase [Streptomyces sp. SID5785]MZD07888.1 peptidase S41 [Streptomyces sp. SID5785]